MQCDGRVATASVNVRNDADDDDDDDGSSVSSLRQAWRAHTVAGT